ncbi:MAG: hypothetical protein KDC54_12255 [Lewinella sp.]|nr:hypothetical protein [Lewinella sp.]
MATSSLPSGLGPFRPFVPARDFATSRQFYLDLGFRESWRADDGKLSQFIFGQHQFLLQDYWLEDWAHNTMFYQVVEDVETWWAHLQALDLPGRYGVRIRAPFHTDWNSYEIHLHDPAGVLWFFGRFKEG